MTSLLGILSLVSALTATGCALSCTQCMSTSSTCSGSSITCPAGTACSSSYTETVAAGGGKAEVLIRSCAPSSECNSQGSISMKDGKIRMVTACCSTDGCTPTLPTLPTNTQNLNGVVCRSCISAQSAWCYTSDTVECRGEENMCLLQTTDISGTLSTAIRGCSTPSFCHLGSQSQTVEGTSVKVQFTCTNGGISAHKVILTPAIACLLLLKFFF